jgi:putative PIN family toxin of toxin-antitoxin system
MKKENKSYKIIIDTNVWISFLIGKNLKGLQKHIDSSVIKIIICDEQIQELIDVFNKPKLKKYFSKEQILEFFDLLNEASINIKITSLIDLCRDKMDNYLLSLANDSGADFIITGDNDLLELIKLNKTVILKFTEFEKVILKK